MSVVLAGWIVESGDRVVDVLRRGRAGVREVVGCLGRARCCRCRFIRRYVVCRYPVAKMSLQFQRASAWKDVLGCL